MISDMSTVNVLPTLLTNTATPIDRTTHLQTMPRNAVN